jgi:hypothetical protein
MFATNCALAILVSCLGTLTVQVKASKSALISRSWFELLHKDSFLEKQKASLVGTKVLKHLKSIKIPKNTAVESSKAIATLSESQSLPKTEERLMSAISNPAPKTDLMPENSYSSGAKLAEDSALQLPGVHVRSERIIIICWGHIVTHVEND